MMDEVKDEIILQHQRKRRFHKIKLGIVTTILILIAVILIGIYFVRSKKTYIKYQENSSLSYKVNLLKNEFYNESYLDEGIDVIASVIEDIDAEFRYDLILDEKREYTYKYKIIAKTNLKEKSKTNSIYEKDNVLLNQQVETRNSNKLNIVEKINLDYNEYNNQVNQLIETYTLANTTSNLHLSFQLSVIDKATGKQINSKSEVMSLEIPLTTKTVEITENEGVKNTPGKIVLENNRYENVEYILIIGCIFLIIGIVILVRLVRYILDTRSAEKMYEDQLKKILFDYQSYIQKINNKIPYKDYKIIVINSFKELIEMKEEIQSPIFMYNEDDKMKTTFAMINGNLLFGYVLSAELIRKELIKKSKEKKERHNDKN